MVNFTILAGGCDIFNSNVSGPNPSWITLHPTNQSILYVLSDAVGLALSTGQVAVVNYASANGRIIPTTDTPLDFDDTAIIISFRWSEVLVPDLNGSPGNWSIIGSIAQPTGSRPRHITKIPSIDTATAALLANVSIVPPDPPFPVQYIYASNRNVGEADERGDTIAIFRYVEGKLELVTHVYTGLDQIRTMEFSGEGSEYLVAGGVAGDGSVAVFRRVDKGRSLEEVARNTDLPFRSSFVWL
ncbi:putative isomerase YbhE [Desarmillaria ectypa]|nr:putative isomerase YbhE [Desarmillaria ectypa]